MWENARHHSNPIFLHRLQSFAVVSVCLLVCSRRICAVISSTYAINACKFQIARMSQTIVAQPYRHLFTPLLSILQPLLFLLNIERMLKQENRKWIIINVKWSKIYTRRVIYKISKASASRIQTHRPKRVQIFQTRPSTTTTELREKK